MHKSFVFPIKCLGSAARWKNPEISNGGIISNNGKEVQNYDPFDHSDLLPSFVKFTKKVTKKMNEDKDINKDIISWYKKWGCLRSKSDITVDKVKLDVLEFNDIWNTFQIIINNNAEELFGVIEKVYKRETRYESTPHPIAALLYYRMLKYENRLNELTHDNNFDFSKETDVINVIKSELHELESMSKENQFQMIRLESIFYITGRMSHFISDIIFTISNAQLIESNFTISPQILVKELISVIYFQMYVLLCENKKKICPVCNNMFNPSRPNQVYCPPKEHEEESPCKRTAKSRRYREKLKEV